MALETSSSHYFLGQLRCVLENLKYKDLRELGLYVLTLLRKRIWETKTGKKIKFWMNYIN